MAPLFSEENIVDFNIITLQKPWKNTYQNTTFYSRKNAFELAYIDNLLIQVYFYINKKIALAS